MQSLPAPGSTLGSSGGGPHPAKRFECRLKPPHKPHSLNPKLLSLNSCWFHPRTVGFSRAEGTFGVTHPLCHAGDPPRGHRNPTGSASSSLPRPQTTLISRASQPFVGSRCVFGACEGGRRERPPRSPHLCPGHGAALDEQSRAPGSGDAQRVPPPLPPRSFEMSQPGSRDAVPTP